MEFNLNNIQLLKLLASCITGGCIVYFTAYLKVKAKNKGLQEDTAKLENEKQAVISRHKKEIEELKKNHSLDVEKRKYQYESKRDQYYQLMEKIDSFCGCLLRVLSGEFSQIMNAYYAHSHQLSNQTANELTIEFNLKAQQALAKIRYQESELFSQLNGFKLSASNEITALLEDLIVDIQQSKNGLEEVLYFISSKDFQMLRGVPEEILSKIENKSNLPKNKERLMSALKKDLSNI